MANHKYKVTARTCGGALVELMQAAQDLQALARFARLALASVPCMCVSQHDSCPTCEAAAVLTRRGIAPASPPADQQPPAF